jgi:hypothetical protein
MGGGESVAAPETATSAAPEKYKLSVDGQEMEVDLEELKRGYGTNAAATRRFQKAAEMAKEAESIKRAIKDGDFDYLEKHLPKDKFLKAAEKALLQKIEWDELPDHEKELRRLKQEIEKRDAETASQKKEREESEYRTLVEAAEKEIDQEITEVLKESKIRANPLVVKLMTDFMLAPLEAALASEGDEVQAKRMSAKDAMRQVDAFLTGYLPGFLESLTPEQAIKYLPKSILDHYRESEVRKITERQPTRRFAEGAQTGSTQRSDGGPKSIDQAFDEIEKKLASKRR